MRRFGWMVAAVTILIAAVATVLLTDVAVLAYHGLIHATTGKENSSVPYGLWSGFIPCLAYASLFSLAYRHLNCHVDSCKKLGFHHVDGTVFKVCRNHHPHGGNTIEHIHGAHKAANPHLYNDDGVLK